MFVRRLGFWYRRLDSNQHVPTNLSGLEPHAQLPHYSISVYFGMYIKAHCCKIYSLNIRINIADCAFIFISFIIVYILYHNFKRKTNYKTKHFSLTFPVTQGFKTTGRMGRMGFSPMSLGHGWGCGGRTYTHDF